MRFVVFVAAIILTALSILGGRHQYKLMFPEPVFIDQAKVNKEKAKNLREKYDQTKKRNNAPLFAIEIIRHGARSHYEDSVPAEYFDGVKKGYVTPKGSLEHRRIGLQRRNDYINEVKFLSKEYQPGQILSMSTFKQRCATSGEFFLSGLYPLTDLSYFDDMRYFEVDEKSVLYGTSYAKILENIDNLSEQCQVGPVIQMPHDTDIMLHTRNCKKVHNYLNKDEYDVEGLERMMDEEFGADYVKKTKAMLKEHFGKEVDGLRQYFTLLDAITAEYYQVGKQNIERFQRQECFILANNFYGPNEMPSKVYLSRMVQPMVDVFNNVIKLDQEGKNSELKYLILNLHDTNVSNFLRFLGYFEENGYEKFVRFSSSVRMELYGKSHEKKKDIDVGLKYYVKFFYDNEELTFDWCSKNTMCTVKDLLERVNEHLISDLSIAEAYCEGNMGEDYINELKHHGTLKKEASA